MDEERAQANLDDASALIRAYCGLDWMTEDGDGEPILDVVPDAVVSVTLQVAARLYTNPKGYASEQIGQYSYRIGASEVNSGLSLTPSEKQMLTMTLGTNIHSVKMTREGLHGSTTFYLHDEAGFDPIPYGEL